MYFACSAQKYRFNGVSGPSAAKNFILVIFQNLNFYVVLGLPEGALGRKKRYFESLKSTNLTELCQISLGHRWIRKSNKLTKSKVNPNGTPMYDKFCFGKFYYMKDKEIP